MVRVTQLLFFGSRARTPASDTRGEFVQVQTMVAWETTLSCSWIQRAPFLKARWNCRGKKRVECFWTTGIQGGERNRGKTVILQESFRLSRSSGGNLEGTKLLTPCFGVKMNEHFRVLAFSLKSPKNYFENVGNRFSMRGFEYFHKRLYVGARRDEPWSHWSFKCSSFDTLGFRMCH